MSVVVKSITPKEARKQLRSLEMAVKAHNTAIRDRAAQIQSLCTHDWSYESDPSGNNDSGWSCRGCGKWSRRKP